MQHPQSSHAASVQAQAAAQAHAQAQAQVQAAHAQAQAQAHAQAQAQAKAIQRRASAGNIPVGNNMSSGGANGVNTSPTIDLSALFPGGLGSVGGVGVGGIDIAHTPRSLSSSGVSSTNKNTPSGQQQQQQQQHTTTPPQPAGLDMSQNHDMEQRRQRSSIPSEDPYYAFRVQNAFPVNNNQGNQGRSARRVSHPQLQVGQVGQMSPMAQMGQMAQLGQLGQVGQVPQVGQVGQMGQVGQVGQMGQSGQMQVAQAGQQMQQADLMAKAGQQTPRSQHNQLNPNQGHAATPTRQSMHASPQSSSQLSVNGREDDPVRPFLEGLAHAAEHPQRQAMWTDLIRLKTKSVELQIAEARAKERTAELELNRLQQGVRSITSGATAPTSPMHAMGGSSKAPSQSGASTTSAAAAAPPQQPTAAPSSTLGLNNSTPQQQQVPFGSFSLVDHSRSPVVETSQQFGNLSNMQVMPTVNENQVSQFSNANGTAAAHQMPQQMTPFDLEAMLQGNNLDNLFSWLPDDPTLPSSGATGDLLSGNNMSGGDFMMGNMGMAESNAGETPVSPSFTIKRPLSPDTDTSPPAPAPKRGKPRGEKKVVTEVQSACLSCNRPIARVLLRAPRGALPTPVSAELRCPDCTGVRQPPSFDPHGTSVGSHIGSTEARKRMRTAMEEDDLLNEDPNTRRCFCDVCQRVVATGQVVGGAERTSLGHLAEVVCASCDSKYQRCTDCGGGGGPRVGIGKWRLKQLFQPGRKTCSLSHSRLGDRPREIGVHVTPTDFTPEQLKEVVTRCKTLWNEKTLSRLAVPEMLEIDLPPNLINPLRNFQDVDEFVTSCWPSREGMIRADGVDPNRFKRMLGLTWAHSRPRRTVRTVDLEEEYARNAEDCGDDDMSTVLANVKRTNVVIPAGSELIGMWGGEWDMEHGSLLVSTLIPFEGADGEDSTALSVGELITKVQQLQQHMNNERIAEARKLGKEPELVRPCEHLWVVSGGNMPLIRERMADILVRKRSFVHVEEYLTRHPDFLHALQARPVGLHPGGMNNYLPHQVMDPDFKPPQPLILVRWLGKDFDAQRILEIKQMEFGGGKNKNKVKKGQRAKEERK